jgi:hypothetical protein
MHAPCGHVLQDLCSPSHTYPKPTQAAAVGAGRRQAWADVDQMVIETPNSAWNQIGLRVVVTFVLCVVFVCISDILCNVELIHTAYLRRTRPAGLVSCVTGRSRSKGAAIAGCGM